MQLEQEDIAAGGVPICGNCDTECCNEDMELPGDHTIAKSPRTRVVTMQVAVLAEDAEQVQQSLYAPDDKHSWYYGHCCPLGPIQVATRLPTADEDSAARENLNADETEQKAGHA